MTAAAIPQAKQNIKSAIKPAVGFMLQPVRMFRNYDRADFRPDLIAGLTVAVILLPQSIAFAVIAELPPEMGLYAAVVAGIAGAMWGSSNQNHNGPTNATSLLLLSTLSAVAIPGTPEYIVAAGVLAVMVGVFQLFLGLARLGVLINFVSHSVIVGFATGAGVLIAINQIEPLLGLNLPSQNILQTSMGIIVAAPGANVPTTAIGLITIVLIFALQKFNPKLPASLISMIMMSLVVFILSLDGRGVAVIGELPSGLPPLADLPLTNFELISELLTGSIAVGAIGLVSTTAIARSIATQTRQRLDSNQEFVGQGMANLLSGLFSGFAVAGSFSRSAVNFRAGAKTPVASILSSIFVLVSMFFLGPFARYLPRSALAGVLIVTAINMVDREEIGRILRGAPGDAAIMVVTFLGTMFLPIATAVLLGIVLSFVLYVMRTSTPRIHAVLPDKSFRHFYYQPERDPCPQLGIIEILGGLYFGAVNHVEEFILEHSTQHPDQRFLLLRMHNVNHIDFSGIHMLESIVDGFRSRGGDVFMVRANPRVMRLMESTGFIEHIHPENFIDEDIVISKLFYHVLDPAVCIYECPVRVFRECLNLPKRTDLMQLPVDFDHDLSPIPTITAASLWDQLHTHPVDPAPLIVDVREPREFRQTHIAEAVSLPLPKLLSNGYDLPQNRPVVLICRTGRRSRRAAHHLESHRV